MSAVGTNEDGYAGRADPSDTSSDYNALSFIIEQVLGLIATATPVVVRAVNLDAGTVDVQPMVNLIDSIGRSAPHGIISGLPFFRLQGGPSAIILDPAVGDIGKAVFADRDVSAVKANKAVSNPGSRRTNDFADGFYFGGFLNATPTQWVRFTETGIDLMDVNTNSMVTNSSGITINGVLFDRNQNVANVHNLAGSGTVTFAGHTLANHTHGGVTTGAGVTSTPTG